MNGLSYLFGALGVGILIFALVFSIAPLIGGHIETAVELPADSDWNSTYNANIPTGGGTWGMLAPFLGVTAIVILAGVILYFVRGMAG